ncbi:FAD-dependent oxidoreductase [Leuconostocaceae bacterium ESL0723]|nr:FAD-dependent oxidoreductase [Leuconostocaceae bacterium ESL0723]
MKVIVVGASHGGHESAVELLTRYENNEVTVYEAGDFISFMSCGMELYLEGKATQRDDVRNFKPEDVEKLGGQVYSQHQVTKIDPDKHEVEVKNLANGETFTDTYDKLILSSGVTPTTIPVPGNDLKNVFLMRGRDWATKLHDKLHDDQVKNVVVVGAGYIGIEAAEVFAKGGKNVTIVDRNQQPLANYLDPQLGEVVAKTLSENGVNLDLGRTVSEYQGTTEVQSVKTDDGCELPADLVIVAAGVTPNTDWLKGTVDLEEGGFIKTDPYLRTSAPDIYAVGDAIKSLFAPAGKPAPIALASAARRQARYVAETLTMTKPDRSFPGINGSSALSVFDYHLANTGVNAHNAELLNLDVAESVYHGKLRPNFVTDGNPDVWVKLTYHPESHQILGGQILSKGAITAHGNTISLAITAHMTLEDLAEADFFFQPGFDRQWSVLNIAAQTALGETPAV